MISDLLNLTGPAFLAVYALIGVAAAVVGLGIRVLCSGPFDRPDYRSETLAPHELAALGGGARASVVVALVSLAREGHVVVEDATRWRRGVPMNARAAGNDRMRLFERGILESLPSEGTLTTEQIVGAAGSEVDQINRSLRDQGLLTGAVQRAIGITLGLAPFMLAIALGVAKANVGLARNKPIAILCLEMVALAALAVVAMSYGKRTVRGWRVMGNRRADSAALLSAVRSDPERLAHDDLAMAVAIYGAGALVSTSLADVAMATRPPRPVQTTGDAGVVSCGAGSGCGGGSSCGGGGGCGGCGS